MPRALTEQEKCRLCNRLLEKGKPIVLSQGIRKVSVDEITKAAGMAKGSFYLHFESKEDYIFELIVFAYQQVFQQAEQMIQEMIQKGEDLRENIAAFLMSLFHMPEMVFMVNNHHDIEEFFASRLEGETQSIKQMEIMLFENLLALAGIDTDRVRPGVVHNYLHALFLIMGSDLMTQDDLPETFDRIRDSLVSYIYEVRDEPVYPV